MNQSMDLEKLNLAPINDIEHLEINGGFLSAVLGVITILGAAYAAGYAVGQIAKN